MTITEQLAEALGSLNYTICDYLSYDPPIPLTIRDQLFDARVRARSALAAYEASKVTSESTYAEGGSRMGRHDPASASPMVPELPDVAAPNRSPALSEELVWRLREEMDVGEASYWITRVLAERKEAADAIERLIRERDEARRALEQIRIECAELRGTIHFLKEVRPALSPGEG